VVKNAFCEFWAIRKPPGARRGLFSRGQLGSFGPSENLRVQEETSSLEVS
jgi:hypothetical protein